MESRLPLGDDLFLSTINDANGRTRIKEHARAILLGAGLLAELMELTAITVHAGHIQLAPDRPELSAPATGDVMSYLSRDALPARPDGVDQPGNRVHVQAPVTRLKDWLEVLGTESYSTGLIAHRMYLAGRVVRVHVGLRRRVEFRPANLNDALGPYVHLGSALEHGMPMRRSDVLLFGLLLAADLTGALTRYWPTLAGHGPTFLADRYADRRDTLTPSMAALVDTTRAVLAERALNSAP